MERDQVKNGLIRGLSVGWRSVQQNWLPAVILQGIMVALGLGYYFDVVWILNFFEILQSWKQQGGYLFSFLAAALAAGWISEFFRVYFVDAGGGIEITLRILFLNRF